MHQTTIYLDNKSVEVLEKYFKGKLSKSEALKQCVCKWYLEGCPVKYYGHEAGNSARLRCRVGLPDEVYSNLPAGLNLSFSIREYLKTQFL